MLQTLYFHCTFIFLYTTPAFVFKLKILTIKRNNVQGNNFNCKYIISHPLGPTDHSATHPASIYRLHRQRDFGQAIWGEWTKRNQKQPPEQKVKRMSTVGHIPAFFIFSTCTYQPLHCQKLTAAQLQEAALHSCSLTAGDLWGLNLHWFKKQAVSRGSH